MKMVRTCAHCDSHIDALDAKDTAALNFGGFEDSTGQSHQKTRKEIMEEIIAKSKQRKVLQPQSLY